MPGLSQQTLTSLVQPMLRVIQRYRPHLTSQAATALLEVYMDRIQSKQTFEYHAPSKTSI